MTLPSLDRGTVITIIFSGTILIVPLFILRFLYPITPTEAALATIGVGAISRTLFRGFFGVGFRALQRSGIRTLKRSTEVLFYAPQSARSFVPGEGHLAESSRASLPEVSSSRSFQQPVTNSGNRNSALLPGGGLSSRSPLLFSSIHSGS